MKWAMGVAAGLVVVVFAWGYVLGVESRPAPAPSLAAPSPQAADAEAQRKAREDAARLARDLARTRYTMRAGRPRMEFENSSVKDVLNFMAEVGRFSVVYARELEEAGVDLATRTVTIRSIGLTYEEALNLVLPRECGYRIEAGYVLVTTLEKSWLPLQTRTYSIQLTLAEIPDFSDAPRFEVASVLSQAGQAAGGGGVGGLFGTAPQQQDTQSRATPERIIEMVKKFVKNQNDRRVAPWDDEGGPATITYLSGRLIVAQTDHGHRAVAALLAKIE